MKDRYFRLSDNFREIISKVIADKKIDTMTLIPTGWTNIVYEVKTDDGSYFFRFPRDEFWSRTIVKDYEFTQYIYGKTNFNTIKLELFYDNERPFSMHKKIEGTPLAEKMNELNEEQITCISNEIAQFMNEIHNLDYSKSKIFKTNNIGLKLKDFLDELLSFHITEENRQFWKMVPNVKEETNCLVHGDLNSSNILLDENNHIAAIIDFGFAGYGNKYDDIARIIGRCPDTFRDKIVNSYEECSNINLSEQILNQNIETWNNIDNAYIDYMKTIGIY
ncbi:MAG: aminoglycoside phosphotransferase family protein [Clostridia bacterium]